MFELTDQAFARVQPLLPTDSGILRTSNSRANVWLPEVRAAGEVRLLGAQIGWQLSFHGATLANPGRVALDAQEVQATTLFLLPN